MLALDSPSSPPERETSRWSLKPPDCATSSSIGDTRCWSEPVGAPNAPENCSPHPETFPAYSSEGLLYGLHRNPGQADETWRSTFYFAGRPIAELDRIPTGAETWRWLTTDHLGTPALATSAAGLEVWRGGFEPFGQDFSGARVAGVDLRFPGQWEDETWRDASLGADVLYNLHRWYSPGPARYWANDPFSTHATFSPAYFSYADARPSRLVDPLGLFSISPECLDCGNPILVRDSRRLSGILETEVKTACELGMTKIQDVALRSCIEDSCRDGLIKCSLGVDDTCGESNVLGYTPFGGNFITHWLRRNGLLAKIRTAVVCANQLANFAGEAGNTVIHEWAHGCGYDADEASIPGIPDAK